METEIEAKFLNTDVGALRIALQKSGATLVHEERLMRRKNFDHTDSHLEKIGGNEDRTKTLMDLSEDSFLKRLTFAPLRMRRYRG